MSGPLLELVNLSRYFSTGREPVAILKNIHLTIQRGEMVAIVGASGSGKSTLMNILGCLDRQYAGSYRVAGQEVKSLDQDAVAELRREHFGFIFQSYHLLPHLDALQNTEVPAVYAGVDKAQRRTQAQELLTRLGLGDRCNYRPSQLSGGQQQRVSIARALMNGGEVILADEPTGALDKRSGEEIMQILAELHAAGHTIILVTHDSGIARHAQRIIEISDGEIISDQPNLARELPAQAVAQQRQTALQAPQPQRGMKFWQYRFAETIRGALISIVMHRMRTFLTMLGIIIGITSVVSVVAISQGARQKIINDISAMGTNVIDIYPGKDWGDQDASSIYTLVPSDLEALKQQNYVDSATPGLNTTELLRYRNVRASALVNGIGERYFRVRNIALDQGRLFTADDITQLKQVAIIDPNTQQKLFPHTQPLGRVILVGNLPCLVIGVTKKRDTPMDTQNLNIWLPYTTSMVRLCGQSYFSSITVRVKEGFSNQIVEANLIKLLQLRHGKIKDFYTNSSDSIAKAIKKVTATMVLLVAAIAVISLLVGGIGVMNIMLVAVSERTREIGIRMAVGARQQDILWQFLMEAVLVCLVGGIIGILASYGVGIIFSLLVSVISMKFSLLSVLAAFFCSSCIGIIFGYVPARNAARLDPIVALARD